MSYGYTLRLAELNKRADSRKFIGVRLGRLCISKGVPVAEVAHTLKVSRQTIYNWFVGDSSPLPIYEKRIKKLADKIKLR